MAKTTIEKIAEQKTRMEQLENELKRLMQLHKAEERKARTNRLCKRHGLFESLLPDTIPLSEDNFKTFLEKTVANDFGRRTLAALKAAQEKQAAPIGTDKAAPGGEAVPAKPASPAPSGGSAPAEKAVNFAHSSNAVAAAKADKTTKPGATG